MQVRSLGIILIILCVFFSLPKELTEKIRELCVSGALAGNTFSFSKRPHAQSIVDQLELHHLQTENLMLKDHLEQLQDYLLCDDRLERDKKILEDLQDLKSGLDNAYRLRREQELFKKMHAELKSVHAKVVFREPTAWNSCFWINVGSQDNIDSKFPVIALSSPVVSGDHVIGVIDYVGKRQSRVRLITDHTLCISVRVIRGSAQNKLLLDPLMFVTDQLRYRQDLFFSEDELEKTLQIFDTLKDNIKTSLSERFLAKGEIQGSSMPLWRSRSLTLKGSGFNYDFADEEGPPRDLRTGNLLKEDSSILEEVLIKDGDVLVTTGYDGIFPAGLKVGYVTEVDPLEEGAISYTIKAKAAAYQLYELSFVQVLPPVKEGFTEGFKT